MSPPQTAGFSIESILKGKFSKGKAILLNGHISSYTFWGVSFVSHMPGVSKQIQVLIKTKIYALKWHSGKNKTGLQGKVAVVMQA